MSVAMGNEESGLGGRDLDLLLNLAQLEHQLRREPSNSSLAQAHGWDPRDCSPNMTVKDDHLTVSDATVWGYIVKPTDWSM